MAVQLATFGHFAAQALSNQLKQLVASSVPESVIDIFKAVEINKQDCQAVIFRFGVANGFLELLGKKQAVGQAGQHIVLGKKLHFLLVLPSFGNVGNRANHLVRLVMAGHERQGRAMRSSGTGRCST